MDNLWYWWCNMKARTIKEFCVSTQIAYKATICFVEASTSWLHMETGKHGFVWVFTQVSVNLTILTVASTWWRHQMETFSALLAICVGKSLVIGEFPSHSDAELWCFLWSAPREAGDLRHHRAHYDIIVMRWKPKEPYVGKFVLNGCYRSCQPDNLQSS